MPGRRQESPIELGSRPMQKTKFLMTFCNNWQESNTNFAELIVTFSDEAVTNIELEGFSLDRREIVGTTGVVVDGDRIAIALQGAAAQIVYVDKNYNAIEYKENQNIIDIHGIVIEDGVLICASTGNNLIIKGEREVYARSTEYDGLGLDVEHINDICWANGRLVASKFGSSRSNGLRNGCVYDVKSGEVLLEGLNQPHSVFFYDNDIYVMDSLTGHLFQIQDGSAFGPKSILKISGYARGLCITDRFILVGSSKQRTTSRKSSLSTGEILFSDEQHMRAVQRSGIYVYDRQSRNSIFVDVERMSSEVYQIIELPSWSET